MSRFQASSRVGPSSVPRALDTGAHNSEKRYDRPRVLMHSYHLYTYTIDIQPENRVLISQSFGLAHEVGRRLHLSRTGTRRACHGRSDTRAHNSEKRYDRPRVLMHSYHLYTYTIDIQPENRVLTSQSFGLANEVGLAFTSAVRVPVERATGLSTRAHNSEKRYDRPRVLMHFYHLYTYAILASSEGGNGGGDGGLRPPWGGSSGTRGEFRRGPPELTEFQSIIPSW